MTFIINIKCRVNKINENWLSSIKNIVTKRCKKCNIFFNSRKIRFTGRKTTYNICILCRIEDWFTKFLEKTLEQYKVKNVKELEILFIERHIDLERRKNNEFKVKGVIVHNAPICKRILIK